MNAIQHFTRFIPVLTLPNGNRHISIIWYPTLEQALAHKPGKLDIKRAQTTPQDWERNYSTRILLG